MLLYPSKLYFQGVATAIPSNRVGRHFIIIILPPQLSDNIYDLQIKCELISPSQGKKLYELISIIYKS